MTTRILSPFLFNCPLDEEVHTKRPRKFFQRLLRIDPGNSFARRDVELFQLK